MRLAWEKENRRSLKRTKRSPSIERGSERRRNGWRGGKRRRTIGSYTSDEVSYAGCGR